MSRFHSLFASCLVGAIATLVGCGETTATSPSQLNLDRPTDLTFGCFGPMRVTDGRTTGAVEDPVVLSSQPTTACEIRSSDRVEGQPAPVPPGQEDLTAQGGFPIAPSFWFGFILQSGPGTVAIARFETKQATAFSGGDVGVLDADPLTPGKNGISIGEDPIAIGTDASGCKVLTANAGSCDLSVLDIASAVDGTPSTPIDVQRLEVKSSTGVPLRAKPAAMAVEPAIEVYGKTCSATATGLVYIAYPSCHLVAAVDAATGTVVGGVTYDAAGVPTLLTDGNVTCPDECTGGGTITDGTRPVTLDLERDPRTAERRLVIGADNSASFTLVELDELTTLPESLSQIALEDPTGSLGITKLAMTPQMGMGGAAGVLNDSGPGGQFQFVYAITTDETVRVADILSLRKECDTQVDPRFIRDIRSVKDLSCLPVGEPTTPQRRPGARGPGIELVGDGVPVSIEIVKSKEAVSIDPEDRERLIGYFGLIGASNGLTFVVNIDDDVFEDLFVPDRPLLAPMENVIAHQLRDAVQFRSARNITDPPANETFCDSLGPDDGGTGLIIGGPRATTPPQRAVPVNIFAPEKATQLPNLRQLMCVGTDSTRAVSEVVFSAPEEVRDRVFPDLHGLKGEDVWTFTWEGPISNDRLETDVDGPQTRESQLFVDGNGMRMVDQSRPFCDAGVQQFDILQIRGCDPGLGDSECPLGYRCFIHPNSQVPGIGACMLDDEADRLAEACKDFLTSLRRYTVGVTESGTLQVLPRRHVLRTTPIDGCISNEQCDQLADYQAKNSSTAHPKDDMTEPDERTWSCEADANRPAIATGKRCQLKCDVTDDCIPGTICQGGTGTGKLGYCMEGVVPPQACVNAPQRYDLRVGDAFSVLGAATGFEHATIVGAGDRCVRDPDASPLLTGRIPLLLESDPAAACDPAANPLTGKKPDGTFEPNPCALTVENIDIAPLYSADGTCTLQNPPSELRARQAPAIRFRNRGMNVTFVDPYYSGDRTCILDRLGAEIVGAPKIPHVFTGYQVGFRQTAGFSPLALPINPAFPVKVVRGPTNSIWVIDEGDFLSTSINQASTRGKVFRVEPHQIRLVNLLE